MIAHSRRPGPLAVVIAHLGGFSTGATPVTMKEGVDRWIEVFTDTRKMAANAAQGRPNRG